jgi:hypothetical protein
MNSQSSARAATSNVANDQKALHHAAGCESHSVLRLRQAFPATATSTPPIDPWDGSERSDACWTSPCIVIGSVNGHLNIASDNCRTKMVNACIDLKINISFAHLACGGCDGSLHPRQPKYTSHHVSTFCTPPLARLFCFESFFSAPTLNEV